MKATENEMERTELLKAIKDSVGDARFTVKRLSELFMESVQPLRLEESEAVFSNITRHVNDLQYFLVFMGELKAGMSFFNGFGLPDDPISSQNAGINLFREINSSFETKDWIMLSDLIEYELSPLLLREDEWFGALDGKLSGYKGE
jgi:hypothetical protein